MAFLLTSPLPHLSTRAGDQGGCLAHNICWMIAKLGIQALLSPSNPFHLYLSSLGMKLKLFFRNLFNQMESKASLGPQISLWASSLYLGGAFFISKGFIYWLPKLPSFSSVFGLCQGTILSLAMHWKVKCVLHILILRNFHRILWECSQSCWGLRSSVWFGARGLGGRACIKGWEYFYLSVGWMTSSMGTMLNYHLDLLCSLCTLKGRRTIVGWFSNFCLARETFLQMTLHKRGQDVKGRKDELLSLEILTCVPHPLPSSQLELSLRNPLDTEVPQKKQASKSRVFLLIILINISNWSAHCTLPRSTPFFHNCVPLLDFGVFLLTTATNFCSSP